MGIKNRLGRLIRWIPAEKRPLLILSLLPLAKWLYTVPRSGIAAHGADGGYYLDIAQNVAAGAGFVTDISPFNQGMAYLPHPSPVYPLWPLLLGWVGKIVSVDIAAYWLPVALYFLSLVLAWKLGRAWSRGRMLELWGMEFHCGHVLVFLFAFSVWFYETTSMPYTEGLAFTLLFAALYRMHLILPRLISGATSGRVIAAGCEVGVWCAILFLVRSQLLIFGIAWVVTLPWIVKAAGPRVALLFGVSTTVTSVMVFLPEALYLAKLTPEWFSAYVRFDQFQATASLPRLKPEFPINGLTHFIGDRLWGLLLSQTPGGHDSYSRVFHAMAYAPPIYLGMFLFSRQARTERVRVWRNTLSATPAVATPWIFILLFSAGAVASLHNIHLNLWHEWHFGQRQALVAGFAIALCWLGLLDLGRAGRKVAALLLVLSIVLGVRVVARTSYGYYQSPGSFAQRNHALVTWIGENSPAGETGRVIWVVPADWGKHFAAKTPGAGYQEYQLDASQEDLMALFEKLGGEYLVLEKGGSVLSRLPPEWLEGRFSSVKEVSGARVYRYRR